MESRRKRGQPIDPDVRAVIEARAALGFRAASIWQLLAADDRFAKPWRVPSERKIRDLVKEVQRADAKTPVGPRRRWDADKADAEDAALVLPVWGAVLRWTQMAPSRHQLYLDEADRIAWIRRVAPDIPPLEAFHVAQAYRLHAARGQNLDGLHRYLALQLWRDPDEAGRAFDLGVVDWLSPSATNAYVETHGSIHPEGADQ